MSIQRAYRVFRTLGLRHLLVVNTHNQVTGMVTRHNLASSTHHSSPAHTAAAGVRPESSSAGRCESEGHQEESDGELSSIAEPGQLPMRRRLPKAGGSSSSYSHNSSFRRSSPVVIGTSMDV